MSDTKEILKKVDRLIIAHKQGLLGGEKMPEDENPGLDKSSKENLMYFTLPIEKILLLHLTRTLYKPALNSVSFRKAKACNQMYRRLLFPGGKNF